MATLIHASNMSLDGWTEDDREALDWAPTLDSNATSTPERYEN